MNTRGAIALGSLTAGASAAGASGGLLTPISSNRLVSVLNRETFPQTLQSFMGPQFGPWMAQAFSSNASGQPNYNPAGSIVAFTSSQQSSFSSSGVSFSGFVFIDYTLGLQPVLGGTVTNHCETVFHVDGNCPYQLNATFTGGAIGYITNTISLHNNTAGTDVFSLAASGARSGFLATGDYTLRILIDGASMGVNQVADVRSQIDATFAVPAPSAAAGVLLAGLLASRRRR